MRILTKDKGRHEYTGTNARQRKKYLYILEASESGRNGGRGEWRSWTSRGKRERTRATVLQLASPGGEKSCKEKGKRSTIVPL